MKAVALRTTITVLPLEEVRPLLPVEFEEHLAERRARVAARNCYPLRAAWLKPLLVVTAIWIGFLTLLIYELFGARV